MSELAQNPNARVFKCTRCQQEVPCEIPRGDIVNKPLWSGLIMPHQEVVVCAGCGQTFTFVLKGFKAIEYGWMEVVVQGPGQNNIVLPGDTPVDLSKFRTNH